jgi:hypothetical protein
MGYIAQRISTKEVFYSKGANKLADLIGCHPSTITKNAKFEYTKKEYNGFIFAKVTEIANKNRGAGVKVFKIFV